MNRKLLSGIKSFFAGAGTNVGSPETEPESGVKTALFRCLDCEKTYITVEMQSCPECRNSVEPIPNERDLGIL